MPKPQCIAGDRPARTTGITMYSLTFAIVVSLAAVARSRPCVGDRCESIVGTFNGEIVSEKVKNTFEGIIQVPNSAPLVVTGTAEDINHTARYVQHCSQLLRRLMDCTQVLKKISALRSSVQLDLRRPQHPLSAAVQRFVSSSAVHHSDHLQDTIYADGSTHNVHVTHDSESSHSSLDSFGSP